MQKLLMGLVFTVIVVFVLLSFGFNKKENLKPAKSIGTEQGFALVELFTSEGCSSCPPADKAVEELAHDYPANVFVLGFHVDYWNYLGWRDAFSDASYSKRQEAYASAFALNSIYTPQVVVNGKTQFTGSDKSTLYETVKKELAINPQTAITLTAKANGATDVSISYETEVSNKMSLCIALVQQQAISTVTRGENKGKLLHHIDVVRSFKTVNAGVGSTSINIPEGIMANQCKVIAFLQQKDDMHIISAAAASIN